MTTYRTIDGVTDYRKIELHRGSGKYDIKLDAGGDQEPAAARI